MTKSRTLPRSSRCRRREDMGDHPHPELTLVGSDLAPHGRAAVDVHVLDVAEARM